ncbi:MAG: hypothetical protein GX375_05215 [Clostridiales bacterium]|nr:hypothetical protein [Clostridiales bacterium]
MKISIKRMSKGFMDLSLTTKVIISYSIMFIVFFVAVTFSYQGINNNYTLNMIKQMSLETAESISNNFDTILDTVNNQSKILISNSLIQDSLIGRNITFDNQIKVSNYLAEFINFDNTISSIYILDLSGNKYYIENDTPKAISLDSLKKQEWFDRLIELKARYSIIKSLD